MHLQPHEACYSHCETSSTVVSLLAASGQQRRRGDSGTGVQGEGGVGLLYDLGEERQEPRCNRIKEASWVIRKLPMKKREVFCKILSLGSSPSD
jgi:hypothetical protein